MMALGFKKMHAPPVFSPALFYNSPWKQPRYPWTEGWIRKRWCVYTIEYYSVIKRNECDSVELRWMN